MNTLHKNAAALERDFNWLAEIIQRRFTEYFQQETTVGGVYELPAPPVEEDAPYPIYIKEMEARIIATHEGDAEHLQEALIAHRLLLLVAMAPHLKPASLDIFFTRNTLYDRGFTEFGGVSGKQHRGFIPTGETIMFLLAGADLEQRTRFLSLFEETYFLFRENVLDLRGQQPNEPFLSGVLSLSDKYLAKFTSVGDYQPRYGSTFPASRLQTGMVWEDMILPPHLQEDVLEILAWIEHEETIMVEMGLKKFTRPGFRAMFHGPPGTGKTLCATLIGQRMERPVYRIDLSQVVSKYIGETEKNLSHLFDVAERKNWILFFDEADALFGKRTTTKSGNDRYANWEVAYLLQRIEDYDGLVILSTNLKGNIDEAFSRRFQAILYFPIPDAKERLKLWENMFRGELYLSDDVDLAQFARNYELSGGSIVNVVRYCALAVLRRNENVVLMKDIINGIRREFQKTGQLVKT